MRSLHPCPIFPYDLSPAGAKSLSLLFILQELLKLAKWLSIYSQKIPDNIQEIALQLEKFLLFSLENPFTKTGGGIDKLCFYCESLLQASKVNDETSLFILEEMRHAILQVKGSLTKCKKENSPFPEKSLVLIPLYENLQALAKTFFLSLYPFLEESRTNENLLLYFVEHQKEWNFYLGSKTIETLFRFLFPSGPYELKAAICEGYTRRGFASFYAAKESLVDAIEWDCTPCLN